MAKRELVVEMLLHVDDGDMRTRGCKTLKHCLKGLEMLLEGDETQTPTHKTLKRCSKTSFLQNDIYPTAPCALAEILPRPPCAPSFNKSRFFRILQFTYLHLYIFEIPYMYTRGES